MAATEIINNKTGIEFKISISFEITKSNRRTA